MGLSTFLQSEEIMKCTREGNPEKLLGKLVERGNDWYAMHPEEREEIRNNLVSFDLPSSDSDVNGFQYNLILHYYEKLLGICLPPRQFAQYLRTNIIESDKNAETLRNSLSSGRAVLLASSHFGAVELTTPFLALHGLTSNVVLRFKTEMLAQMASAQAERLAKEADFGKISFIQIGRPGTSAAMEMAAALRRKEILLSIFDEKTEYSKKVSLFGKELWGGAGIDRIIRYSGVDLDVFTVYMIRTGKDTYKLHLDKIDSSLPADQLLAAMYSSLENVVRTWPQQWYFLHEEIPFV